MKGAPKVELHAATSSADGDFVVKLIDVHPEEYLAEPQLVGYQLGIAIEIFRGRYVHGFATPAPLEPGKPYAFRWVLPDVDHVLLPEHRIMVRVQSSLILLYDRNPQGWVPSIIEAKQGDYVTATQTIHGGAEMPNMVMLPIARDGS